MLGSLTKRGSRFPHRIQRRSFVVYPETREPRYFEGAELRGAARLVGVKASEAYGVAHGIYFEGEQRMVLASADSELEQAHWPAAVQASLLWAACAMARAVGRGRPRRPPISEWSSVGNSIKFIIQGNRICTNVALGVGQKFGNFCKFISAPNAFTDAAHHLPGAAARDRALPDRPERLRRPVPRCAA